MDTEQIAPPGLDQRVDASVTPRSRFGFLFAPIAIGPLIFFRITFGLLMFIDLCCYTFSGTIQESWIDPRFHFTYFGFSWVHPLPGNWTYLHVAVLLLSSVGITLGFFYRLSALIFAVGFAWYFLIEQSNYLNHHYLIVLVSFAAIFLPANRALSLDARRHPRIRSDIAPAWTLHLLRAQLAIVYFFGGIAKINPDWLRGEPFRTWMLARRAEGKISDFFCHDFFIYLITYGGLIFDLLIVPLLLWKRTRIPALFLAIAFHLSNALLINIGVFPFLGIALTLLFLPPGWHTKLLRLDRSAPSAGAYWRSNRLVPALFGTFLFLQIILPLRHWLYGGNVHWTEEGHRFAWHMMLRTKNGHAYYIVEDHRAKKLWRIDPQASLSERQYRKMTCHPEMLLQFAHHIRDHWQHPDIAVYAVASVSLNHRPPALLIDPTIDLTRVKYGWRPARWILPPGSQQDVPVRYDLAKSHALPSKS